MGWWLWSSGCEVETALGSELPTTVKGVAHGQECEALN